VASRYPDEAQSASDDGGSGAELPFPTGGTEPFRTGGTEPFRTGGTERTPPLEARPELRDRETYYAELRFAVHCQSRSVPQPRAALDEHDTDLTKRGPGDEVWDDMTARFGDTWT